MGVISRTKFDQLTTFGNTPKFESTLGSRYQSDTPHFPYVVLMSIDWSYDLCYWLLDCIGENHKEWEWWYGHDNIHYGLRFEFKNEEDKVKFILRWL